MVLSGIDGVINIDGHMQNQCQAKNVFHDFWKNLIAPFCIKVAKESAKYAATVHPTFQEE